eukprot:scaffold1610_cov257-Pinguiococcus_pyrenoidosus.AAC.28
MLEGPLLSQQFQSVRHVDRRLLLPLLQQDLDLLDLITDIPLHGHEKLRERPAIFRQLIAELPQKVLLGAPERDMRRGDDPLDGLLLILVGLQVLIDLAAAELVVVELVVLVLHQVHVVVKVHHGEERGAAEEHSVGADPEGRIAGARAGAEQLLRLALIRLRRLVSRAARTERWEVVVAEDPRGRSHVAGVEAGHAREDGLHVALLGGIGPLLEDDRRGEHGQLDKKEGVALHGELLGRVIVLRPAQLVAHRVQPLLRGGVEPVVGDGLDLAGHVPLLCFLRTERMVMGEQFVIGLSRRVLHPVDVRLAHRARVEQQLL